MKRTWTKLISSAILAGSCGLLLSSSCARQPIQTFDESSEFVTVEGAFADWSPTANPFTGGQFVLVDAATNEVFTSDIRSNSFKIENVPAQGRYFGLLIGADYQVKGKLAKAAAADETYYYIFKLGNSGGQLGTLVLKDKFLESSQQAEIDFTAGPPRKPDKFAKDYSPTFSFDPDIDGDGLPNMFDTDVDNDDIANIYDEKTYNQSKISDSKIPWNHNFPYGIPKFGFFKCDQLSKDDGFNLWCSLKTPPGFADKVTIQTYNYQGSMLDDGEAGAAQAQNRKDAMANDGIWTAHFSVDSLRSEQLIKATIKAKSGATKTYFTTIGPKFKYRISINGAILLKQSSLSFNCKIENWPEANAPAGFDVEILLLKGDLILKNKTVSVSDCSADESQKIPEIDLTELDLQKNSDMYSVIARLRAPAGLPGLVGSASETVKTEVPIE